MRQRERLSDDPSLVGIVAGDVLPSVSRRDERRSLAEVWTSGNRVFRCADTAVLQQICRAVARKEAPVAYVFDALCHTPTPEQSRSVDRSGEQLRQLIHIERSELNKYGW